MRTLKQVSMELVEVEFIPEREAMEVGKFYYSRQYNTASHLCPCGCGQDFAVPIKDGEWNITISNGKLSVTPSLHHRIQCRAHYIITNGVANIVSHGIPKEQWYARHGFQDSQPGE